MIDFKIENSFTNPVIGVDEVGRGPLAGPVVSCACVFFDYQIDKSKLKFFDDSKKLSEESSQLNELIQKSSPHTYSILIVKKAEKVEKLAKRIKKRAKRGFR